MRGVSRTSTAGGAERLEALLDATPEPAARIRLGEELFVVAGLLDSSVGLRRALTDPSRDAQARVGLLERLLRDRAGQDTVDLTSGLVRSRWSRAADLGDAVESLGVQAVLASAEAADRLEDVEDQVFRLARAVRADAGLRQALRDRRGSTGARTALVTRLLGAAAAPETVVLCGHVAAAPRERAPEDALDAVATAAATRRQRLVARVTVAAWPTTEQQSRLVTALARTYGRQIRLAIDIDPEILGGVRVQVGDEVVDGTISRRLEAVGERLNG